MLVESQLEEHGRGGHLTTMGTLNKRFVPFIDPRSWGRERGRDSSRKVRLLNQRGDVSSRFPLSPDR